MKESNFIIENIGSILIVFSVIFIVFHFYNIKKNTYKNKNLFGFMSVLTFLSVFGTVIYYKDFYKWDSNYKETPIANPNNDSRYDQKSINKASEKNKRVKSSTKYCRKHGEIYNPKNAYGGCPQCFDKSWKDELNKPGGFRDRLSRP